MPETLLQKDVRLKRFTTVGYAVAQALNDPVRLKILEILSHKQMSAEEVVKALSSSGFKKATTTIRHHLETLKCAGLIQPTKMIEVRGAVMKYYSATMRAYSYEVPVDIETRYSKLIDETSNKMLKVLKSVHQNKKFLSAMDGKNKCNLCKNDHYAEFVALDIVNISIAKAMQRKEYVEATANRESATKSNKV